MLLKMNVSVLAGPVKNVAAVGAVTRTSFHVGGHCR
ncbi:hypothetical protein ACVINW_003859 [Bradyrhizobium sp. USDA 4461]